MIESWAETKRRLAIDDAVEALLHQRRADAAQRSGYDPVRFDWAPFTAVEQARARSDVMRALGELGRVPTPGDVRLAEARWAVRANRRPTSPVTPARATTPRTSSAAGPARTASTSTSAGLRRILGHVGVPRGQARELIVEWIGLAEPGAVTHYGDLEIRAVVGGIEVRRGRGARTTTSRVSTDALGELRGGR